MNVTLIRVPTGYCTGRKPNIRQGLYLLPQAFPYLGRALEKSGHAVSIVDAEAESFKLKDILDRIQSLSPDVIGIHASTPSWALVESTARHIRESFPDVVVVLGGPHVTFEYKSPLYEDITDYILLGEAEYSFTLLLEYLSGKKDLSELLGIATLENNNIYVQKKVSKIDLDEFGIPGYHLVNLERYKECGGVTVNASRGCNYKCNYCLNPIIYGNWRGKSPDNVLNELLYLKSQGVKELCFTDPYFTCNQSWVSEICSLMSEAGCNLKWACTTRIDSLSEKTIKDMAEVGCFGIFFGLETTDPAALKSLGKYYDFKLVDPVLDTLRDYGIKATPSFMIGLPGETVKSAERTLEVAKYFNHKYELDKHLQINTLAPFPGTEIRENAAKYGLGINNNISYIFYPLVPVTYTKDFPYEAHLEIWHRVWKEFFPDYFDIYMKVERCAFEGLDPYLRYFEGDL